MGHHRIYMLVGALLLAMCHTPRVLAFSAGISGFSGKGGSICNSCHGGGVAPTVHFEGPTTVAPGTVVDFRFVIQSNSSKQTGAGFDVAASNGQLGIKAGEGEQQLGPELTQTAPKDNDTQGIAAFAFTWKAPSTAGTSTLFGAGNSVNLRNGATGDQAAAAIIKITVGGANPTATATPSPTALPTATATTARGQNCVGDCNHDGEVTVDELITGVNIALGTAPLSQCPVFDVSGDGEVTIDELLTAVNSALNGCPVA